MSNKLLYKTISTPACEKTHRKKINLIKQDTSIQITEIRTMYDVVDGGLVWKSRILYKVE